MPGHTLESTGSRRAGPPPGAAAQSGARIQLSQVLTASVREVAPLFARRGLGCTYAEHHCRWLLEDRSRALERSFHRLYVAAADMLRQGFIAVDAAVHAGRGHRCKLQLQLGGTGLQASSSQIDGVLELLGLHGSEDDDVPLRGAPRLRRASGTCPAAGAHVEFAALPHAGFLFNVHYVLQHAQPAAATGAPLQRVPARAWLVHADPVGGQSALRSAQAQGWSARLFASTEQALRRLRQRQTPKEQTPKEQTPKEQTPKEQTAKEQTANELPQLVVLFGCEAMPPAQLRTLQRALPDSVHFLCALLADSAWLQSEAEDEFELCCQPLSSSDWQRWHPGHRAMAGADAAAASASAQQLPERDCILIVDDDPVSGLIASAMVEAEGFEARYVDDGLHAADACRRFEPVAVLMDMDMPGLNGLLSTRGIRDSQRQGLIAPSRIVVCSATTVDGAARLAADAGADAFLPKPLQRSSLRAQLRPTQLVRHGLRAAAW